MAKRRQRTYRERAAEPTLMSINLRLLADVPEYARAQETGLTDVPELKTRANVVAALAEASIPAIYRRMQVSPASLRVFDEEDVLDLRFNAIWGELDAVAIGFSISEAEMRSPDPLRAVANDGRVLLTLIRQSSQTLELEDEEKFQIWNEADYAHLPPLPTKHFRRIAEGIIGGLLQMPQQRDDLDYIFVSGDNTWYDNTADRWSKLTGVKMTKNAVLERSHREEVL